MVIIDPLSQLLSLIILAYCFVNIVVICTKTRKDIVSNSPMDFKTNHKEELLIPPLM